ncbi:MAG: hypothetical protein B6244_06125 [Candidatus Cloacimonetes bacterium 4572_55]|nr:MAG: hypothetical protein B6244_06125 [Candidatus Cloacimonetes bacterium 4572_55]
MKTALLITICFLFHCSELTDTGPAGDARIILTFDDAHKSIYTKAFPIMQSRGFVGVNYVPTGFIGSPNSLNTEELRRMEESGWETGGHTVSHPNLTAIPIEEAEREILEGQNFLRKNDLSCRTFALPSGHANEQVMAIIKEHFESCRGSEDFKMKCPNGYSDSLDPYSLGYYFVNHTTSVDDIKSRILRGIVNQECLIIIGFHKIIADKEGVVGAITPSEFRELLEFIENRGLKTITISDAF